jgi:hypothetical protein
MEFYDLEADPRETLNLAGDPALAEIIKEMQDVMKAFFDLYSIPSKSGLNVLTLPMHNPWEIWRMRPPGTWDAEGSDMRLLRAYVKAEED